MKVHGAPLTAQGPKLSHMGNLENCFRLLPSPITWAFPLRHFVTAFYLCVEGWDSLALLLSSLTAFLYLLGCEPI